MIEYKEKEPTLKEVRIVLEYLNNTFKKNTTLEYLYKLYRGSFGNKLGGLK